MTRITRPKRVTTPYSVVSTTKNEETSGNTVKAAVTASRERRRRMLNRPDVVACSAILAAVIISCLPDRERSPYSSSLLLALAKRLHEPHVEVFHLSTGGSYKLPHARQHLFERFKLQPELGKLGSALISFKAEREGV